MAEINRPEFEEDIQNLVEVLTDNGTFADLIVYNDDHNTFEWVIQCFIEVLGYESAQSEQLAIIIHTKGKATVLSGTVEECLPKREQLVDRGLSAVVEEIEV